MTDDSATVIRLRRRVARGAVVGAAIAGCVGLTGCSGGAGACPAIGYTQTVTVVVVGDIRQVASVVMCDADGACSRTEPEQARDDTTSSPYLLRAVNGSTSEVTLYAGRVPEVVVTAYREDGSVVGSIETPLAWTWLPDSATCGGPTSALPVIVPVA